MGIARATELQSGGPDRSMTYPWIRVTFIFYLLATATLAEDNEQLEAWVRENSEIFVLLKHWKKLPLVSTTWKRIKDTPEVSNDRKIILENLDHFFRSKVDGTLSNVVLSESIALNSFQDFEGVTTTPVPDCQPFQDQNLLDRIDALELKMSQLNPVYFQSQQEVNRLSHLKYNGQSKANAGTDPEWKQFKDVYDSDKKWIQSQFVPLNYLFDKLKVIEDETKELRNMSPLVTVTHSTAVPENYPPHGHIVREFKSKLENLESQNQIYLEYHKNLEKKIMKIDELVNLTRQELRHGQQQDTEEFEYCPNRLEEMIPCAEVGESCYCFSKIRKNWTEAYEYCESHNMSLLSLETPEESLQVGSYIKESGLPQDFYWTSGKDDSSEGNWMWTSTQENVTFENWRSNQPDGEKRENCLYLHSRDEFKWGDWLCQLAEQFICEW